MLKKIAWENDTLPLPPEEDPRNYTSTGGNLGYVIGGGLGIPAALAGSDMAGHQALAHAIGSALHRPKHTIWNRILPWRKKKVLEANRIADSLARKAQLYRYGSAGLKGLAAASAALGVKGLYNLVTGNTRENKENRMMLRRLAENASRDR